MQHAPSHDADDTRRDLSGRIDAFGWGLSFIWVGIAFLADVGWPLGIAGLGVIAVGSQIVRRYEGLHVDRFGLAMGLAMVGWGGWSYFQPRFGPQVPGAFWPVLLIAAGAVLVARAVLRRQPRQGASTGGR